MWYVRMSNLHRSIIFRFVAGSMAQNLYNRPQMLHIMSTVVCVLFTAYYAQLFFFFLLIILCKYFSMYLCSLNYYLICSFLCWFSASVPPYHRLSFFLFRFQNPSHTRFSYFLFVSVYFFWFIFCFLLLLFFVFVAHTGLLTF